MRIEEAYVAELSDEEQAAYDQEYAGELDESREQVGEVPASIQALFAIPYAFGAPFVATLLSEDGNEAIDDAFRNPPTTEEHLFDPASYLALEVAIEVELGSTTSSCSTRAPSGARAGTWCWPSASTRGSALDAVLGWNGDHYGVYEKDGRTCIRIVFAGDSERDEMEMRDALATWAQAMPGGLSTPIEVDGPPRRGRLRSGPRRRHGPDRALPRGARAPEPVGLPHRRQRTRPRARGQPLPRRAGDRRLLVRAADVGGLRGRRRTCWPRCSSAPSRPTSRAGRGTRRSAGGSPRSPAP